MIHSLLCLVLKFGFWENLVFGKICFLNKDVLDIVCQML